MSFNSPYIPKKENEEMISKIRKYINSLYSVELYDEEIGKIMMSPNEIICLVDASASMQYVVIMYSIIFTHGNEIIKAEIPYYISDGHTNQLRANMIFPFICFNNKDHDIFPNCFDVPIYGEKLVIKLSTYSNLDLSKYQSENIDSGFKLNKDNSHKGLQSVLARVPNIIDFLLAVNNTNIINYTNYDIKCFRPQIPTDQWYDKYNMEYCANPLDEKIIKSRLKLFNNELYRTTLLLEMNKLRNIFKDINLYKSMKIPINNNDYFIVMNKQQFNERIAICIGKDNFNLDNILNYQKISIKADLILKKKIDKMNEQITKLSDEALERERGKTIESTLSKEEITKLSNNFSLLNKLIIKSPVPRDNKEALFERINEGWGTPAKPIKCHNKYLKYKIKYLKLKNMYKNIL